MPVFPAAEPRLSQPTQVGDSAAAGVFVFLFGGAIFGGLGTLATVLGASDDEWIPMIFGGLFMLIGLGLMAAGFMQFLASRRLSPPARGVRR